VLIPDIMGLRPLFDEHAQRLATTTAGPSQAVEPWPGREAMPLEERLTSVGTIDDRALLA
jgi:carboxymethylenebutenolidase